MCDLVILPGAATGLLLLQARDPIIATSREGNQKLKSRIYRTGEIGREEETWNAYR